MNKMLSGIAVACLSALIPIAGSAQSVDQDCGFIVLFNNNSSGLTSAARNEVQAFSARHPGAAINVSGFTDAVGSATSNQGLSERRASTVATQLRSMTGNAINITRVAGFGEAVRPGTTGPNDPRNRRVEVVREDCLAPALAGDGGLGMAAAIGGLALVAVLMDGGSDSDSTTGSTGGSTGGTGSTDR